MTLIEKKYIEKIHIKEQEIKEIYRKIGEAKIKDLTSVGYILEGSGINCKFCDREIIIVHTPSDMYLACGCFPKSVDVNKIEEESILWDTKLTRCSICNDVILVDYYSSSRSGLFIPLNGGSALQTDKENWGRCEHICHNCMDNRKHDVLKKINASERMLERYKDEVNSYERKLGKKKQELDNISQSLLIARKQYDKLKNLEYMYQKYGEVLYGE